MSRTTDGMTPIRKFVDERRGDEPLSIIAFGMGWSGSRLGQKLNGERKFTAPEAIQLARVLGVDPLTVMMTIWPELVDVDRLGELRLLLADASDDVLAEVVAITRSLTGPVDQGSSGEARKPGSA